MADNLTTQEIQNLTSLHMPQRGDMWEDHLVKVALVIKVTDYTVFYVKTAPHPDDSSALCWDYRQVHEVTLAEFTALLATRTQALIGGTWADVHRRRYLNDIPPESEWSVVVPSVPPPEPEELIQLRAAAARLGYRLVPK